MSLRFAPFALVAVLGASLAGTPPLGAQAERARETPMRRLHVPDALLGPVDSLGVRPPR